VRSIDHRLLGARRRNRKKIEEKAAAAQRAQEEINATHTTALEAERQRVERLGAKPRKRF
jgi:hypothetical protein